MIRFTEQWKLAYIKEMYAGNAEEVANEAHIWMKLANEPPHTHPERNRPLWLRYLMFGKILPKEPFDQSKVLRGCDL